MIGTPPPQPPSAGGPAGGHTQSRPNDLRLEVERASLGLAPPVPLHLPPVPPPKARAAMQGGSYKRGAMAQGSWVAPKHAVAAPPRPAATGTVTLLHDHKDGKVKGRSLSVVERRAPLKRAVEGVGPEPHTASRSAGAARRVPAGANLVILKDAAKRIPLMERDRPVPPLRPPLGASPGELRLWKMQNGIPV